MHIYIYLDIKDKKTIVAKAQKLQLSFGTFVSLITESYMRTLKANEFKEYIHKGEKKVHTKGKLWTIENARSWDVVATNCVYRYLYQTDELANRKLQSLCDKTEDPYYNYNYFIRNYKKMEREQK